MADRDKKINIAANIIVHRKARGITQEQLAERLYVSPKTVSKWERDAGCLWGIYKHVGEASKGDYGASDMYTRVKDAIKYCEATGVDALAVAIGTAHGAYKSKPRLDLSRLSEIRDAVDVPLVLHGGSGLSDDDLRSSIEHGISKVNIFTDLCLAGVAGMRAALADGLDYLEARNRKVEYIRQAVKTKIMLFGSNGRA